MEIKLDELLELRKTLHLNAELSGREKKTASLVKDSLGNYPPDQIVDGIDG